MFAMTWRGQWPPSAAGECRRLAAGESRCSPAGTKGGKGTVWFPCPLLTPPKPSFALRLPSVVQRNGGNGGSVPCVEQLLGRCYALNLFCVICSAVSARPDDARRLICAAKSSASIKCCILEHQTSLWAPRIWTRDRRESRPKEDEGDKKPFGVLSPSCSRR